MLDNHISLAVKPLSPKAILPSYATPGAAGMDLHACLDEPVTIQPGQRVPVPTGLAIALPGPGYAAFLFPRSGLGVKAGITLPNCVGVVDSDYRGEITVGLINLSDAPYTVQPGDRIAQMVILPVVRANLQVTDTLDATQRGAGGFGSTGK